MKSHNNMPPQKPDIVFMGTPGLAAYILNTLLEHGCRIAAVVTSPDKPSGRGRKMRISEVKKTALEYDLKILQPENLSNPDFINDLKTISPDVQIVVAFRKLPREVWKIPPLGTFNLHASLLPNYRGAAPINRVIINGEKYTGVTTFFIDENIDTGKILLREKINIEPNETAGSLHEKIKTKGSQLVIKTLEGLVNNSLVPVEQKDMEKEFGSLKKAHKIFREDCRIDWNKSCSEIVNLVRGLSPNPGAFTELRINENPSLYVKIFEAIPEKFEHNYPVKSIITDNKTYLKIATPDGAVNIKKLQLPGKRRITAEEFLRGYDISK